MPRALIALGSNLGDRRAHLIGALAALDAEPGVDLVDSSSFMEFDAVQVGEGPPGGAYLNAAATVNTTLSAPNLMDVLRQMEHRLGRDRRTMAHGAPRVIDLDLILYDEAVISKPSLTVPHPAMHDRVFVLRPAAQIAGDWRVPTQGATVRELLARLEGAPA